MENDKKIQTEKNVPSPKKKWSFFKKTWTFPAYYGYEDTSFRLQSILLTVLVLLEIICLILFTMLLIRKLF